MKIALVCGFSLYAALKRFSNSENSVQNVIITGITRFIWANHVLNGFLRKIHYYKHCLSKKAPSVRDFSVFSYLRNLGPLQLRNLHIRLLEENFEKKREFQ